MVNKIVACICCSNTRPETIASLMQVAYSRIISGWTTAGIGLLPFVRNNAIFRAYEYEPDFTHLLFIDDDMCNFTEDHVQLLLDTDKDIVSGVITTRFPPHNIVSMLNELTKIEIMEHLKKQSILEEPHVGMAFTLVKRRVLDTLRQPNDIWFTMDRMPRKTFMKETVEFLEKLAESTKPEIDRYKEAIGWGRLSHVGSELLGEDVEFCRRARALGFKSYTHCGVCIGHIGTRPFTVRDNVLEGALKYVEETHDSQLVVS